MTNDLVSKYEPLWDSWYVDSLIGEGSYGKVYQIRREEFGITHYSALKIISIPQNQSEIKNVYFQGMDKESASLYFRGIVQDIYSEINLMAQLKGKTNIVSYEDHKIIPKEDVPGYDILIRMELLKSINDVSMPVIDNELIVKMGEDICQALMLCEKHNIIHRDIKPDNIFMSEDGDFKLGDFGIAKQIEKRDLGLSIKGSFEYMAPEVYHGKNYDKRVDIYSLGIVLYTFLNNRKTPFLPNQTEIVTHGQRQEALKQRLGGSALLNPVSASEELSQVIKKACAFEPEDRYRTPEEFYHALQNVSQEGLKRTDTEKAIQDDKLQDGKLQREEENDNAENVYQNTVILSRSCNENANLDHTVFLNRVLQNEPKKTVNPPEEPLVSIAASKKNMKVPVIAAVVLLLCAGAVFIFTKEPWAGEKQKDDLDKTMLAVNQNESVQKSETPQKEETVTTNKEIEPEKEEAVVTEPVKEKPVVLIQELRKAKSRDLAKVKNLERLVNLNADQLGITNITPLEQGINLKSLSLNGNNIKDISALSGLKELNVLILSDNKELSDIKALEALNQILTLDLNGNSVQDISILQQLSQLTYLNLAQNKIPDISPLKQLKSLTFVDLSNNQIKDVSSLMNLTNLKEIYLEGNPVSKEDLKALKKALPDCKIK